MGEANNKHKCRSKGQSLAAHIKYGKAIEAADSEEYIEYNISQIAIKFKLTPTGLSNQLRHHYPEILERRENERRKRGIADNYHRGARQWCIEEYTTSIDLLKNTDMTIEQVAQICKVSPTGLRDHLAQYQRKLVDHREQKRQIAKNNTPTRGERTAIWTIHEPHPESESLYAAAIEDFRRTSLPLKQIAEIHGVNCNSLNAFIHQWYPELIVKRRGYNSSTEITDTKRYSCAAADKYASAIERLSNSDMTTAAVATEFGLNPDILRMYVREHAPHLITMRGMTTMTNGRKVAVQSSTKYAEAIRLYATTDESLKSIANRLNLVYNSLGAYVRRNYPELIERKRNISSQH